MNQKLSDWASIAQIVSGIAVVVTLVFLVVGIQANTYTTRAAMYASSIEGLNNLLSTMMADPDLSRIFAAAGSGNTADLDGLDQVRWALFLVNTYRTYDTAYSMWSYGLFGDNEWSRFESQVCANYQLVIDAGVSEAVSSVISEGFAEFIQSTCIDQSSL